MTPTPALPYGTRARASSAVVAAAKSSPESVSEILAPHDRLWCEKIVEGVRLGDRTALRLFAEARKIVGAQVNLAINVWQQMGVSSEDEGRRMIESAMRANDLDPETAWRLSEQFVQEYRREHGLPELVEAKAAIRSADA